MQREKDTTLTLKAGPPHFQPLGDPEVNSLYLGKLEKRSQMMLVKLAISMGIQITISAHGLV
jgi:hypothetical protein